MNNTTSLLKFDRFLPAGGASVYPSIWYYDANDIGEEIRIKNQEFFLNDIEYKPLFDRGKAIFKGSCVGKRVCVYVYRANELLGSIPFYEFLDNPHGYGKGDFLIATKRIYPEYRRTKYSRYAFSDIMHILFCSGIANRLYMYTRTIAPHGSFYDRVDRNLPCMGEVYDTDGSELQRYILIKAEFPTPYGNYMLVEFNGEIYKKTDLEAYFMASPGRDMETVKRWLREMNAIAESVRLSWKP
jgi:hypothetical protein